MVRRLVYFQGRAVGGLKFLLRTGTSFSNYQWWVGGDRPTPSLIDTSGLNVGTEWLLTSIVATGPSPDDWVACAVDGDGSGGRVAFIGSVGVLRIGMVAIPSGGAVTTDSTGNFASRAVISSGGSAVGYWSSVSADGGDVPLSSGYANNQGFYFLPNVIRDLEFGVSSRNTKRHAVANSGLTYALRAPNALGNQTLYRANGSRTTLSTPIVGQSGSAGQLSMFFQACSLIDLVLWRWGTLSPFETEQTTTQQATLTADRWQLSDDATWDHLPTAAVSYQLNAGYRRVDMSGWIAP